MLALGKIVFPFSSINASWWSRIIVSMFSLVAASIVSRAAIPLSIVINKLHFLFMYFVKPFYVDSISVSKTSWSNKVNIFVI